MKYLRNPVTTEVTYATPLMAKKLARYGWEYTDKRAWVEYQRAKVQAAMARNIRAAMPKLGRLQ